MNVSSLLGSYRHPKTLANVRVSVADDVPTIGQYLIDVLCSLNMRTDKTRFGGVV